MRRIALLVALFIAPISFAAPVTLESLLQEMTTLEHLTRMPNPAYTTLQFSSYDRNATDPAVQTDEGWYANGDRGKHLREEERNGAKEWVMMDAEGPGAIVRFWSANPQDAGIVRIYLDAAADPVIEAPMADFLGGKTPYTPEAIGGVRGRGWNSYLPIPFAKHCKVTASQPDFYYIINYRKYDSGAEVQSTTKEILEAQKSAIDAAAKQLAKPKGTTAYLEGGKELASGEMIERGQSKGQPSVLQQFSMLVSAGDTAKALRGLILRISFDGKETVAAPVGDFFGTAPGLNPYSSVPMGAGDDALYAHWPMPFKKDFRITVENLSGAPATVNLSYSTRPYEWTEDSLYFHAKWKSEGDIPTRPRRDWNYAAIEGKGRFVGTMLHVANPVKEWWGEGDEKIYIDGAAFPQWFGTGSEDYYGYAWCDNHTFTHAYHNQPRVDGPGNYGHTCVSRFLIMDSINFQKSLKFDMEVWHWKETTVSQAAMSYWYANAASTDNFPPVDKAQLTIPKLPALPKPKTIKGAIEGEKMRVIQADAGLASPQNSDVWEWSGQEQMWWMDAAPGNKLVLGFNVEKAGEKEVRAIFTKAPDYAIATVQINDDPASEPIDFYHTEVAPTKPAISLGKHQLRQGENTITLTITGKNEKAAPRHMLGLDCLVVE